MSSLSSLQGSPVESPYKMGQHHRVSRKLFEPLPKNELLKMEGYLGSWFCKKGHDNLPKNLKRAELELKMERLMYPLIAISNLQIPFILLMSLLSPRVFCSSDGYLNAGVDYVCNVGVTFVYSLSPYNIIVTILPLSVITIFLSKFISGPRKIGDNVLSKIKQWQLTYYLWNPAVLGAIVVIYYFTILKFFDFKYYSQDDSNLDEQEIKSQNAEKLGEQLWILRLLIFCTAVEFFNNNLENGGFTMQMPTNRVKGGSILSLVIMEFKYSFKKSICTSLAWAFYFCIFRLGFLHLFFIIQTDFVEDVMQFSSNVLMDLGFIVRVLIYSLVPRLSLRMYLRIINQDVSQRVNLPLDPPTSGQSPLLLFEAMKGENSFLKHLAFAQYYSKADVVDSFTLSFFQLSHPGNHAVHWRNAYGICCDLINETASQITEFFNVAKLPSGVGRLSQGPSRAENGQETAASDRLYQRITDMRQMRDLASVQETIQPMEQTLVDMLKAEIEKIHDTILTFPSTCVAHIVQFFTVDLPSLVFPNKLGAISDEERVSDLLVNHMLVYWGMVGTLKLFSCSLQGKHADPENVVFQDVDSFLKSLLDLYEGLVHLETYLDRMLDLWPNLDKNLLEQHKKVNFRLCNSTVLVLMEMNYKFSPFYDIIDVPINRHRRICEVIGIYGN